MKSSFSSVFIRTVLVAFSLASAGLGGIAGAQGKDTEGGKDHPLVSRYPGSYILDYAQKEFDEFDLPLAKEVDEKPSKSQHLEGRITYIHYEAPKQRSQLEIYRNFESALKDAGFQTLFTCSRDQCGTNDAVKLYADSDSERWGADSETRYLSAKLSRPAGDAYVSLEVQKGDANVGAPYVYLYVVEVKPMESGLVTVNAKGLADEITRTGHASVYGIYFDTGKADVKPESDAALKEIGALLQQNPTLKLYVVGHTDNQGAIDMNMDLSRRRANAVLEVLTVKYGVAAARLSAQGDGPTAPVASNDTEEGRARNRRVELVKQ